MPQIARARVWMERGVFMGLAVVGSEPDCIQRRLIAFVG